MNDPSVPGLLSRLPEPPHKIILLRASRIGDFLCATPAFRALRKALPGTEITMITLPVLQDLVMRSPDLDRFVAFPGFPEGTESPLIGLHPQRGTRQGGGRWIASQQPEPNYVGDMVGRWCCSVKKMSKPLISLHNFRSTGKLGQIHVLP